MRTRVCGAAVAAWIVLLGVMLTGPIVLTAGNAYASEAETLEKATRPGRDALARVLPELDAMAGPMSRDVLDGKADLHVFYGMVIARLQYELCQDTISLIRSAEIQECPALRAASIKRLADAAARLEGAAELIAGSLPMASNPRVGVLGHAAVQAFRKYLGPIKEFASSQDRREM
ncbi:MAG: hypothetical protein HY795_07455 [Desulfovibrio sp.]|nr:hypothetical protein [Desulfovibrio sp.]MBI4960830.1 hypothetical protein [Desulfovibrio sp.]